MIAARRCSGLWVELTRSPILLFWLAPLFALAAQMGDLFESGLKRRAGSRTAAPGCPAMAACSTGSTGLVPVAVLTAALLMAGCCYA